MDQALNEGTDIMPASFGFDAETRVKPGEDGMYAVALPGITRVIGEDPKPDKDDRKNGKKAK